MVSHSHSLQDGQILPLFVVILSLAVIPLMALTLDATRAMYVHIHLQTAVDAACEAAVQELDVPYYISTGQARVDMARGRGNAYREFNNTVVEHGIVQYSPALYSVYLVSPTIAGCIASAQVERFIPFGPPFTPLVESISELRVGRVK
jgi:hypothetical protein